MILYSVVRGYFFVKIPEDFSASYHAPESGFFPAVIRGCPEAEQRRIRALKECQSGVRQKSPLLLEYFLPCPPPLTDAGIPFSETT